MLKNFYLNNGYYDVKINSSFAKLIDETTFELIYNINANNIYLFNNLNLILPDDFDKTNYDEIYNLFKKLKNKPYSINRIEDIINSIDIISTNEQFESVKSSVEENINDNEVNLNFVIEDIENHMCKK